MSDELAALAHCLEEIPIAAFVTRDAEILVANAQAREFSEALMDPAGRWWGVDAALPPVLPWRGGGAWVGPIEGLVRGQRWHLHVTTAPRPGATSLTLCRRLCPNEVQRQLIGRAVDAMSDMFTLTTSELDAPGPAYVAVNRKFEQISGYDRAMILGKTPRILQGPLTDRAEVARLRRCLEAGEVFRGGTINYRRNGDAFFNEWSIAAVISPSGEHHYVSVMRDATDDRLQANLIRSAATEWARVVDVLDEMVVFVDLDRRILRCNEAFRHLSGRSFQELVGRGLVDLLFPATSIEAADRILRSGGSPTRLPGQAGWFSVASYPVHVGPALLGCVYVLKDVTEREHAEERARRLVTAIEQAHDGLSLLGVDGAIEYLNQAYAGLLGVDRNASVGLSGRALLVGYELRSTFDDALARVRADGGSVTIRTTRERGTPQTEISVRRLTDLDGIFAGHAVSARDLTEHERLERLSEATSAMDNMGHWLSGLRHELGNPVNSVKMALTVLSSNLASMPKEEIERYVDRALSELGRVEYLLRTLRTVSAIDHLDLARIELTPFLGRLADFVRPDLQSRGIAFMVECESALSVHADPHALMQVLINLMANAADAMGTRGSGTVTITAGRSDRRVQVVVRDDGVGMSADRLARLYTPFETSKIGGTGLGLVIVRKLMAAMNGEVQVTSTVGVGTTVTLVLEAR